MNIREYLSSKYGVTVPTTMTSVEAKFFEIPYPLKAGWLVQHGEREVTQHAYLQINIALELREMRANKKASKKAKKAKKAKPVKTTRAAPQPQPQAVNVTSDAFLMSYEWRKLRMVILKRYGARCQCCGATPADGARMNVDHIKPRKFYPHLALEESNLQVLCGTCNHGKGNWDETDWRGTAK